MAGNSQNGKISTFFKYDRVNRRNGKFSDKHPYSFQNIFKVCLKYEETWFHSFTICLLCKNKWLLTNECYVTLLTSELPPLSTLEVEPLLDKERGARTVNCKAGEWMGGLCIWLQKVFSTHWRYRTTSSVTRIILPSIEVWLQSRCEKRGFVAVVKMAYAWSKALFTCNQKV